MSPTRILDSRTAVPKAGPYDTPWGADTTRTVTVGGTGGGQLSLFNATGSTDVIVDLVGYYGPTRRRHSSLVPVRVQNSRQAGPLVGPYGSPWSASHAREVAVAGVSGVPADAVLVNATGTNASQVVLQVGRQVDGVLDRPG